MYGFKTKQGYLSFSIDPPQLVCVSAPNALIWTKYLNRLGSLRMPFTILGWIPNPQIWHDCSPITISTNSLFILKIIASCDSFSQIMLIKYVLTCFYTAIKQICIEGAFFSVYRLLIFWHFETCALHACGQHVKRPSMFFRNSFEVANITNQSSMTMGLKQSTRSTEKWNKKVVDRSK